MGRQGALTGASNYFEDGGFFADLSRRVAFPSTCQESDRKSALSAYLCDELRPSLDRLGFSCQILDNPASDGPPFLIGNRIEDADLVTVLTYGHGDTVRGMDDQWRPGLSPWSLVQEGDRLYGRGTADNKGQHSINIGALAAVLAERGRLGFNARIVIEMGEEVGSPGLAALCERHRGELAADLLIASDGPRIAPAKATIFLGARGVLLFELGVTLRDGAHHSGNWGGVLANPGNILAHALAAIADRRGAIEVKEWRPALPDSVRRVLAGIEIAGGDDEPAVDMYWGEPGLTPAERVHAWNSFDVLAFTTGLPEHPVNAIPPTAHAVCQLRFVVGTDPDDIVPALQRHLRAQGITTVDVRRIEHTFFDASRLDPNDPWVSWAAESVERTTGAPPVILPSLGGSLPNNVFSDLLGLKTIWVPHSHRGCSQHAPNEYLLAPIAHEGLMIMTGLFWDLGESKARELHGRLSV